MTDEQRYEEFAIQSAAAAIAKGHGDPDNLRELLIWTTSKITCDSVDAYFRRHHADATLLKALFEIAAEGDDAGDAPWAAANVIADFPESMLRAHRSELIELSKHPWDYLSGPAREALRKIDAQSD